MSFMTSLMRLALLLLLGIVLVHLGSIYGLGGNYYLGDILLLFGILICCGTFVWWGAWCSYRYLERGIDLAALWLAKRIVLKL